MSEPVIAKGSDVLGAAALQSSPILIEVVRGELLECVHRARVAVTAPSGELIAAIGDVETPMYPRSSNKPLQALAMMRHGLDLEGHLLALAAASHDGEPFHTDGVLEILGSVDLGVEALSCTPEYPGHIPTRDAWIRAGRGPEHLASNCSGKHSAMLRTSVRNQWDTDSYLDLDHPLQQAIAETITEFTGAAVLPTVDGCGAPLFGVSLHGLAKAFGAIAEAPVGHEKQLADAYRAFPEYMSGTGHNDALLHRAVTGLVCKGGAEGCLAIGLADGRGIAIKSDDGNGRGVLSLAVWLLNRMGVRTPGLDALRTQPVLGHGEPVGMVRVRTAALDALVGDLR